MQVCPFLENWPRKYLNPQANKLRNEAVFYKKISQKFWKLSFPDKQRQIYCDSDKAHTPRSRYKVPGRRVPTTALGGHLTMCLYGHTFFTNLQKHNILTAAG